MTPGTKAQVGAALLSETLCCSFIAALSDCVCLFLQLCEVRGRGLFFWGFGLWLTSSLPFISLNNVLLHKDRVHLRVFGLRVSNYIQSSPGGLWESHRFSGGFICMPQKTTDFNIRMGMDRYMQSLNIQMYTLTLYDSCQICLKRLKKGIPRVIACCSWVIWMMCMVLVSFERWHSEVCFSTESL